MNRFKIQVGELIRLNGHNYVIARMLETGEFLLEALDGKSSAIAVTRAKLETAFSKGFMEFLVESWAKASNYVTPVRKPADFGQLPAEMQALVERRHTYVKAVQQVDDLQWHPKFIGPFLAAAAAQVGDDKPPHPQTVRAWYKAYIESDGDIRALMPAYEQRGGHFRRLDPMVLAILAAKIERYYLSPERHTVEDVRAFVIADISQVNKTRGADEQLKAPSYGTVYAEIKKLDPFAVYSARYGRPAAERRFKQSGKYRPPQRPLEKVEIDHTKADMLAVDDETWFPIGRPWITAAIDVYSRMVYGIHIGFVPPSYVSVMHCIRTGVLPKTWLREDFPEVENEWPIHGMIETLYCDNGKEFHSNAFEHAMGQLGVEVAYCSVMEPDQKGSIERFLGTVNRGLLHNKPGTTFSNIFEKEDYDPAKNAIIPMSLLKAIVVKWVCDVYHCRFHTGLGGVPLNVYKQAAAQYPAAGLPRHVDDLVTLFGRTEERTVRHTGIELNGLHYNSPALSILRDRLDGKKTLVRFDEENLGTVHVYDPQEKVYVPVTCTEPEYAEGLTLWQHKVIKRYAQKRAEEGEDEVSISRAKADIQQMVEKNWRKKSKTGHKQKMSRWLGVGGAFGLDIVKDIPQSAVTPAVRDEPEPSLAKSELRVPRQMPAGWGVEGGSNHNGSVQ